MKSFLDNNTDGNKTFLLYGRLDDIFCPTTRVMEFEEILNAILKDRGYKHVVYYGGAGNKGKHCFDAESAKYFFNHYDLTENNTNAPGASSTAYETPSPSRRRPNRAARGNRRERNSEVEIEENTQANETQPAEEAPVTQNRTLQFSQVDIANSEFINEITRFINKKEKIAVVFYNIFDFLNSDDGTNRQFIDQIISIIDKPSVQAVCIFGAPLKNQNPSLLCDALLRSQLRYKFMGTADGDLNRFNTFRIGAPGEDEVVNLLRRFSNKMVMQRDNCMPIKFDFSKLDEYAHLLLHEAEISSTESTTLSRIKDQLSKWIHENTDKAVDGAIPFDDLSPAEVFGRVEKTSEIEERRKPVIERLNRKGWEAVYNFIKQYLEFRHKQYENQRNNLPKKTPDVCVERFAGVNSVGTNKGFGAIPNFVITGNPGTGKSEIGRLIAEVLYSEHILPTSKWIQVGKSDLTNSYIAGIPRAVMECADRAEGGVLLIDEAPQIADKDGGVNNEGSGPEVIQTLNRIMTDPTRHLCVVLTGYKEGMEKLFEIDPGFRSRFGDNEIHIEDYQPPLLSEIFRNCIKNQNGLEYTLAPDLYNEELVDSTENTENTKQPFDCYMEHLYQKRDRRTFGNARDMHSLAGIIARRLPADRNVIVKEDFYGPAPFSVKDTDEPYYVDESWFEPVDPSDSMDELIRVIREDYVGLDYLVERFREIEARVKEVSALQGVGSVDKMRMRSFALIGNPGTGKDVVAELLARLLRLLGVLNYPSPIVKDGNDLASQYSGGSVEKAKEWVKEAQEKNGLLFINEAHQLCNEHFDGKGALRSFIAPMTNKSQFVAAFAVYPGEVEKFYKLDDGLESRLEVIRLRDYTDQELYEIFKVMCKKRQRYPSDEVLDCVSKICLRLYREHHPNDGNARLMEILLNEMDDKRMTRCIRDDIPATTAEGELNPARFGFVLEDIPESWLVRLPERGCNETNVSDFEEIKHKIENKIIGRKELVTEFQALADEINEAKAHKEHGVPVEVWPRPIILSGNPGSGKTVICRLLAELYNTLGLVKTIDPITFDATALGTIYKNGEVERVKEFVNEAIEKKSMIFVDEVHQLLDMHECKPAIQALISPMNDPDIERRVPVVFAVYENRLDELLRADDGLKRRTKIIRLRDYTADELKAIFYMMAKNAHVNLSDDLDQQLDLVFSNLERRQNEDHTSGNAGMSERLLEDMNNKRRARCRETGISVSDYDEYFTLRPDDIPESYFE